MGEWRGRLSQTRPTHCPTTHHGRALDKAATPSTTTNIKAPLVPRTVVEEFKAFMSIMPLFAVIVIYQMCYDPILWVFASWDAYRVVRWARVGSIRWFERRNERECV
jgi:hypothetical protein